MSTWYFSANTGTAAGLGTENDPSNDITKAQALGAVDGDTLMVERSAVQMIISSEWIPTLTNFKIMCYGSIVLPIPEIHLQFSVVTATVSVIRLTDVQCTIQDIKVSGGNGCQGQITIGWAATAKQTGIKLIRVEVDGTTYDVSSGRPCHGIAVFSNQQPASSYLSITVDDIQFIKCKVYNAGINPIGSNASNADGINIEFGGTTIIVDQCECYGNTGQGVDIAGGTNVRITRNNLYDNVISGFKIHSEYSQLTNVYIVGNKVWNNLIVGQIVQAVNYYLSLNILIPSNVSGSTGTLNIEEYAVAKTISAITPGNPTLLTVADTSDIKTGWKWAQTGITTNSGPTFPFNTGQTPSYNLTVVDATTISVPIDTTGGSYTLTSAQIGFRVDGWGYFIDYLAAYGSTCSNYFRGSIGTTSNSQGLINLAGLPGVTMISHHKFGGNYYETLYNTANPRIISDSWDGTYDVHKSTPTTGIDFATWNSTHAQSTEYYNDGNISLAATDFTDEVTGDFTISSASVLYNGNNPGWYGWSGSGEIFLYADGKAVHPLFPSIGAYGIDSVNAQVISGGNVIEQAHSMSRIDVLDGNKYVSLI